MYRCRWPGLPMGKLDLSGLQIMGRSLISIGFQINYFPCEPIVRYVRDPSVASLRSSLTRSSPHTTYTPRSSFVPHYGSLRSPAEPFGLRPAPSILQALPSVGDLGDGRTSVIDGVSEPESTPGLAPTGLGSARSFALVTDLTGCGAAQSRRARPVSPGDLCLLGSTE